MKLQIAAVALAMLLAACGSQTTTPIQTMSTTDITVAYVHGFAAQKDTDKVADMHCVGSTATGKVPVTSGTPIDESAVHYRC
jgi:hypothetical protein